MTRPSGAPAHDPRADVRPDRDGALTPQDAERLAALRQDLPCVLGFDGRFVRLGPGWAELLGCDQEELVDHDLLDFIHPDDTSNLRRLGRGRPAGAVGFEQIF